MILKKICKNILILLGSACVVYSVLISVANRFGLENVFLIVIGAVSAVYALFWRKIAPYTKRGAGKVLKIIFYTGVTVFVISFTISIIAMAAAANKKPSSGLDAVLVLGCGLRGHTISKTLGARLEKAYEYAAGNPGTVIMVSGGQGPGESVTEASAMKKYLISKGIREDRILTEEASTSTKENMLFSKLILDGHFNGKEYTTVIVTSDFHVLRSLEYAKIMDLKAQGLSSKTLFYFVPVYYMREYLALIKLYIFRM